tara:strand:- start:19969 stop:20286 length:318 start_codon:yes stop_codon:yes gene_type:complete
VTEPNYGEMDKAADEAALVRSNQKKLQSDRDMKRIAGALLGQLPKRDQEVLAWVCHQSGKSPGQVAFEMVRKSIIIERRGYREAMGGGGASSQNLETLTHRLPGN